MKKKKKIRENYENTELKFEIFENIQLFQKNGSRKEKEKLRIRIYELSKIEKQRKTRIQEKLIFEKKKNIVVHAFLIQVNSITFSYRSLLNYSKRIDWYREKKKKNYENTQLKFENIQSFQKNGWRKEKEKKKWRMRIHELSKIERQEFRKSKFSKEKEKRKRRKRTVDTLVYLAGSI